MKFLKKIIFLFLITVSLSTALFAQPADPCPDPNEPDCPIDSGVVTLLAAAAGIAIKKGYDFKKSRSSVS